MLEYMHGKNVVHRDLKLENILVDEKMNLKVSYFGFEKIFMEKNKSLFKWMVWLLSLGLSAVDGVTGPV